MQPIGSPFNKILLPMSWVHSVTYLSGTDPENVVRAGGFEPPQALRPNGFSYHLRLSPPPSGVCGLDYPFTLASRRGCCPSSLYTFPDGCAPSGLGSGLPFYRFPRI